MARRNSMMRNQMNRAMSRAMWRAMLLPFRALGWLLAGALKIVADTPRFDTTGKPSRTGTDDTQLWFGAVVWMLVLAPIAVAVNPWTGGVTIITAGLLAGRRALYSKQNKVQITATMFVKAPAEAPTTIVTLLLLPIPAVLFCTGVLDRGTAMYLTVTGVTVITATVHLFLVERAFKHTLGQRERIIEALRAVASVPEDKLSERLKFTPRSKTWRLDPAPSLLVSKMRAASPAEFDLALGAVLPEYEANLDEDGTVWLEDATQKTRDRRALLHSSDGMVEHTKKETNKLVFTLSPKVSPAHADRFSTWIETTHPGFTLTVWEPHANRAQAQPLTSEVRTVRDRVAAQLRAYPYEISITVTTNRDGHRNITFSAPQLLSADMVNRRKIAGELTTSLSLKDPDDLRWRTTVDDTTGQITLFEEPDLLKETITMVGFRERFADQFGDDPATSWKKFPIAIDETGETVGFATFHSLIVGQTGAGKGSAIWAVLGGLMPATEQGYVRLYGIDPKGAEAISDDGSPRGMFQRVATTPDEWAEMIGDLVVTMNARKGQGRSLPVTPEQPLIMLMIDELSALTALDTDAKRSKQVMADLLLIASQGRSLNVLIMAAVQAPQKELLGALRQFLSLRVALRTETAIETDLVLGAGSSDLGGESHLIPVASAGNGYRTAGLAYMRVEGGGPEPVRVRFPYTSDADLDELDTRFQHLRSTGQLPPQDGVEAKPQPERFGQVISIDTGNEPEITSDETITMDFGDDFLNTTDTTPTPAGNDDDLFADLLD